MKRTLVLLLLLLAAPATAGVLEVVCVAPTMDNDSETCDSVIAVPRVNTPLVVHMSWFSTLRGGPAGQDSLNCAPGDTLIFSRWLPGGSYRVNLWATDKGGVGCPTESVRVVRSWPGRVRVVK